MEREIRPFLDGSGCQGERIPITYGERMTIFLRARPFVGGGANLDTGDERYSS